MKVTLEQMFEAGRKENFDLICSEDYRETAIAIPWIEAQKWPIWAFMTEESAHPMLGVKGFANREEAQAFVDQLIAESDPDGEFGMAEDEDSFPANVMTKKELLSLLRGEY